MNSQKSLRNFINFILLFATISTFGKTHNTIFNISAVDASLFPENLVYHDTNSDPYKQLSTAISQINLGAKNAKFNGSILVGYEGKIIWEDSFGDANRAIGLKNTLTTPTQIASITKTFTGTAVLWLHQKGLIDIQDNVQKYLWDFPYSNITVEQLLSHRSGLPDYIKYSERYWSSTDPMYNDEVLKQFATHKFALKFTPGAKFNYCNSNYAILALIIERVSGLTYKDFMSKYVFEPLHMNHTYVFDPADSYTVSSAHSYNANFTEWKNTHQDGVYGDKGIFTTAEDLYKWDNALYTNNFINQETKENAFKPRSAWEVSKNYGLGWRIKTFPTGEKYAYHTGWWHGYQGIFSRHLKDQFTVIILSNRFIDGITENSELIYDTAAQYLPLTQYKVAKVAPKPQSAPSPSVIEPEVKSQPESNIDAEDLGEEIAEGITIAQL